MSHIFRDRSRQGDDQNPQQGCSFRRLQGNRLLYYRAFGGAVLSASPNFSTAAAESPPPIIVIPYDRRFYPA